MTSAAGAGPADQHLGESLAALIDGELSHDSRDRVLAHLATCPSCKAEADAQRRLKSVFAESPLPAPSEGLLARLQGLPATDGVLKPPAPDPGTDADDTATSSRTSSSTSSRLLGPPVLDARRGFRIHEPGAAARSHRGHRLAFAAAGAVSLAAFALGGAVTGAGTTGAAGSGSGGTTVAPGGGVPASTVRVMGARVEGAEETRQPYDTHRPVDATGPLGQQANLLPMLGPILAAGPNLSGTTTSVPAPVRSALTTASGPGVAESDPR